MLFQPLTRKFKKETSRKCWFQRGPKFNLRRPSFNFTAWRRNQKIPKKRLCFHLNILITKKALITRET